MASMSGYEGYGGATITRVVDGAGAEWIGMCSKDSADHFLFRVYKNGANVPLSPLCSGRGTISRDGTWIAWEGNQYHKGALPGFTPLPAGEGGGGAGVPIPAGGAISQLYTGVYVAADFDTPQETATRVQKQLDAIDELIILLKTAGVLI